MKLLLGGGRCEAASNRAIAVVGGIDFLKGSTDKMAAKSSEVFFFSSGRSVQFDGDFSHLLFVSLPFPFCRHHYF